jgi:hypothetical protein
VIRLALEVLAFLFLCWVGLIVLGIGAGILGVIGDALGKLFPPYKPPASRPPSSKTPFALGHDPIEPNHDPRTCPLCRGAGHPSTVRGNQEERERQIEAAQQETPYQHIPGLPWGDPGSYSYVRALTRDELEQAREDFAKREAERCDALAAKEHEAVLEQERKKRDDEKREQEARDFLIREAAAVVKEREEREAAQKREREAEALRTRWIH